MDKIRMLTDEAPYKTLWDWQITSLEPDLASCLFL